MNDLRRFSWAALASLLVASMAFAAAPQKDDKDKPEEGARPKVTLHAQPPISMAPSRIDLTAELVGGADDFQEYYCPTVEWEWGDDTSSESTADCDPYQAGKTQIRRRFSVRHLFRRGGEYHITFRLKQHDRTVATSSTVVQVRPGLGEIGQ